MTYREWKLETVQNKNIDHYWFKYLIEHAINEVYQYRFANKLKAVNISHTINVEDGMVACLFINDKLVVKTSRPIKEGESYDVCEFNLLMEHTSNIIARFIKEQINENIVFTL